MLEIAIQTLKKNPKTINPLKKPNKLDKKRIK